MLAYQETAIELLPDGFSLISCYSHIAQLRIMLTIFNVSVKEKRGYGSFCFELLPQQMSKSKKDVHRPVPACKQVKSGCVGDLIFNV